MTLASNLFSSHARHITRTVNIDHVAVGSQHPIVIQSMTNTDTADIKTTVAQVIALAEAGSELVRLTVNSAPAAAAVAHIKEQLLALNQHVPLIGDFHFNGHKLLSEEPACAQALSKYRINPGNVGKGKKRDSQYATLIDIACRYNKPIRIGVNWGSLDQALLAELMDANALLPTPLEPRLVMRQALVESALQSAEQAIAWGMNPNQIILSCKTSGVQDLIAVYQMLAARSDFALHLGLTEAGMGTKGIIASACGTSVLLQQGIGDTLRVSLTPEPNGLRTLEVKVAQDILQSLELRAFTPRVSACPGCGRTTSTYFQTLAAQIQNYVQEQMPQWSRQFTGVENFKIAVMGCVVNGPGESKHANIGISLPGTGEKPVAPVYEDGEKTITLKGDNIAFEFQKLIDAYISRHYPTKTENDSL